MTRGFCRLLGERFAPVARRAGDAYELPRTLGRVAAADRGGRLQPAAAQSSRPRGARKLIDDAFALMGPDGLFVQFTYGLGSPIPREACASAMSAHCGAPIWRNLPPARVWTYRADRDAARRAGADANPPAAPTA